MAVDDLGARAGEIGLGIDAAGFAGFEQSGDDRPLFSAAVRAGEEDSFCEGNIDSDRPGLWLSARGKVAFEW
jgi:hypothetical protein